MSVEDQAADLAKRQCFAYKKIDTAHPERDLNALGLEGWEAISVSRIPRSTQSPTGEAVYVCILKRLMSLSDLEAALSAQPEPTMKPAAT